jgi:oxygen-independent coproporphyrinogen-3 oxidase
MKTGVYLHVPFCRSRCSYCDFNTYIGMEALYLPYVNALEKEIHRQSRGMAVHTLFFGGGTPSLLATKDIGRLIQSCRDIFTVTNELEITCECNPGTVSLDYLRELREQGVNRLSYGAQSAQPNELKLLGREHDWEQVVRAIELSRSAGFDNLNVDLIFGLPYQTLESWQATLSAACALDPDHISLYALTIEQGTPMYDWTRRGEVPYPDPDAAADMYDYAEQKLDEAGYGHYEISNWCKRERECEHNLIYWRNEPYLGLGAGAHSSVISRNGVSRRWWKVRRPADYIARSERGDTLEMGGEDLDEATSRGETMMLGLRLLHEGMTIARFEHRYGAPMTHFYATALQEAQSKGLIEILPDRVRLTPKGRFLSNQVMRLFV